jgi:hypothetical protein
MAKLLKLPNAQYLTTAVFEANFDDTMVNINGLEFAIGAEDADLTTFDILTPLPGSIVVGGYIQNITVFDSTANTLDLGDSDDTQRYTLTIHDLQSLTAHTVLTVVGANSKVYDGSQAIRATILNTVAAATAGKFIITVNMIVPGRAHENLKTV